MRQRVLVTGAYGFIGRYIARTFREAGFYVIGLGHGDWNNTVSGNWGIDEWHSSDVTMDALKEYAGDCEAIIHCAGSGSVGFSLQEPMKDFERTVWTTHYVLEYIRLYSPQTKLIYPSSAAVYGNQSVLPLREDMVPNPISPYGVHKKIVEELCQMYAHQYHVNAVILRLFSVYGEGLRKQLLWDACQKLSEDKNVFWGTGEETRDWVHAEDVAHMMLLAVSHASEECPIVNVAGGKAVRIADVLRCLFEAYGKKETPFFGGQVNVGNPNHYEADVRQALQWGWKPKVDMTDGIQRYVRWYLNECQGSIPAGIK